MKKGILCVILGIMLMISCAQTNQMDQPQQTRLSPLQTVLQLVEENKQFEDNPVKSTDSHCPEIKEILDKGYIVFGMNAADVKPFYYTDEESGQLIGLDVELAYAIANRMGVKAVFDRSETSFDRIVQLVVEKKADVAISKLSLTMRRAELVRFTMPYITFRQALLINRLEYAKIGNEDRLPGFIRNFYGPLGVINNSSYMNYALANFPDADVKGFDNWDQTVDALFAGEVLAIYRDEGEILILNTTKRDASILMKPVFISDKRDPIAMAVSADAPLLQSWLNIFLDDYILMNHRELTPSRLIERHYGTN